MSALPQSRPLRRITIAVCMFGRMTILETLTSLAALRVPDGLEIEVIVADNNALPSARGAVLNHAAAISLPVHYVHAPAGNISIARNRCLEEVRGEWLAFIDDDEQVTPDWLAHAWTVAQDGVDVVLGPVRAVYDRDNTPDWMVAGDFHSTGMLPRDPPDKGYSGNVLLRLAPVRQAKLRFDPKLGQIGGEDTDFFRQLHRTGARFAFARGAEATEPVPADRASLRWLCRRRFRTGQIHVLVSGRGPLGRGAIGVSAALKFLWSAAAAVLALRDRVRAAAHLQRAMFHAGAVSAAIGRAPRPAYG